LSISESISFGTGLLLAVFESSSISLGVGRVL